MDKENLLSVIDRLLETNKGVMKELCDTKEQLKVIREDRTIKVESNTDWKERCKVLERTLLARDRQIVSLRNKYHDSETAYRCLREHIWRIDPSLLKHYMCSFS